MSIETSKATNSNSSIKNSEVRNLILQDESPLIQMLKGVIVISQYKEGKLVGIWFLDNGLAWKEATSLKQYLAIEESIPDGQSTTKAHIATYPPKALQSIGEQTKEDLHSFILALLSRTESEVVNSIDLRYLLALLEFPILKIGKYSHSFPVPKSLTPTPTAEAPSSAKETEPLLSKKILTKVTGKEIPTKPTEVESVSPRPVVPESISPGHGVEETILTKTSEAISKKPAKETVAPVEPTVTKEVPVTPIVEPSTGANTEINVGAREKAVRPISKGPALSQANPPGEQLARTAVSSELQPERKEEKEISTSQPQVTNGLSKEVTVTRIFWSLNTNQGTIIPTIYFDPIKLGNFDCLKITLGSYGLLEKERIGKNSRIEVGKIKEYDPPKFLKTIIPQKVPVPDLVNKIYKNPEYYFNDKTIAEIEDRLGTFLQELDIEKDPSPVSKIMALHLGITSVPQLIFIIKKDPASSEFFEDRLSAFHTVNQDIYYDIESVLDDPNLSSEKLVLASSSFDLNRISEESLDKLFGFFTIGDLKEIREKNADFTLLLDPLDFDQNEIKGVEEGVEKFEKWWNENSPFLKVERNQIFYSTILEKLKGKKILVEQDDLNKRRFLRKLGATVTKNDSKADIIIIDPEYENLRAMEEESDFEFGREGLEEERDNDRKSNRWKSTKEKKDQIKLSWDEFIEDYLKEAS